MSSVWRDELLALAEAAQAAGVEPGADERLAFNLEAESTDQAREVEARLGAELGSAATVRPLFQESEDPDLGRFIRLEFVEVDAALAEPVAYQTAYGLAANYGLISAEPDLPTQFYVVPGNVEPGQDAESAIVSRFCEVRGTPPPDHLWAVDMVRARDAIAYSQATGRPAGGAEVVVAQPDTGVVANPDLEAGSLDPALGWDLLEGRAGASDPMNYSGNKGHGTATGSVVVSRAAGSITGVAPAARLYPIRCINSVAVFTAEPVARAIEKAVEVKAQVITMSLGGVPSRALRAALRKAVNAGLIVVAAAGNCVKIVVWPARYPECIAVAGCNVRGEPWKGSCRGDAVDITAPAEQVWHASATDSRQFDDGQGTSFAVAIVAGAAAQWLSHHGPQEVTAEASRRGVHVQDLFRQALRDTANTSHSLPPNGFGPGVLDVEKLLRTPLGSVGVVAVPRGSGQEDSDDRTPPGFVELLRMFAPDAESAAVDWRLFGAEVGEVALRRAVSATAEGVELAESTPAPAAPGLVAAAEASGNRALRHLLGAP